MLKRIITICSALFVPFMFVGQIVDSTVIVGDSMSFTETDTAKIQTVRPLQSPVSKELDFIQYLIANELYSDAQFALSSLGGDGLMTTNQTDSTQYFRGWLSYYQRDFLIALDHFDLISGSSHLSVPSQFFSVMCLLELERSFEAAQLLRSINLDGHEDLVELKTFYLSGFALLERNYAGYDSLINTYTTNNYLIAAERANFNDYAHDLQSYKDKSAFLAGFLSALVPGLGKFYAGYRGHPFGALAITVPFAAPAIELALLAGLTSPLFIASGALFGLFYIGNIWGSALSVKTHKLDYYAEIDYNIVIDLHLPLRRVF